MTLTILICIVLAIQVILLAMVFIGLLRLEKNKKLQSENRRLRQLLTEHERKQALGKRLDRGDLL